MCTVRLIYYTRALRKEAVVPVPVDTLLCRQKKQTLEEFGKVGRQVFISKLYKINNMGIQ